MATKDYKLSDLLWDAANKYLSNYGARHYANDVYMCSALDSAACEQWCTQSEYVSYSSSVPYRHFNTATRALKQLGIDTNSVHNFSRGLVVTDRSEQQQIRYSILMFLYDRAIEQGL